MTCPGEFIVVTLADGEWIHVETSCAGSLDAGVESYQSGVRDRVLALPSVGGEVFHVVASDVRSWRRSTPASRQRTVEREHALDEERKGFRADLGVFDEER